MKGCLMRSTVAMLFLFALVAHAQNADLSGKVAFVSLTTAKVVKEGGLVGEFAPKVLLRFTRKGSPSRFLAMTGTDGTAFIPIEAGTYGVEAFGVDGNRAKMSARSSEPIHRCFTAVAGRVVEFSVTLAADAKYGGIVPSMGVD
jgi:hypothetical protein